VLLEVHMVSLVQSMNQSIQVNVVILYTYPSVEP